MILHRDKRTVPQLNTTSTADISFILLVFFLIMTSMDADKGLTRMLPPLENEDRREMTEIEKSNVLSLQITADSRLLADGKPLELAQLRKRVAAFVANAADRRNHIIMIDVDRRSSYEAYFNVQNEIAAAYNVLRDSYAVKRFGSTYGMCTPEQREKVRAFYPQRITETYAGEKEGGGR